MAHCNTVDRGRTQGTLPPGRCRPRTQTAARFPSDARTPRARKSDPFSRQLVRNLRNANVALSRVRAIAKEGSVGKTEPSVLFRGAKAIDPWNREPKSLRLSPSGLAQKPGYEARQEPPSGGSTQPATNGKARS